MEVNIEGVPGLVENTEKQTEEDDLLTEIDNAESEKEMDVSETDSKVVEDGTNKSSSNEGNLACIYLRCL